MKRNHINRIVHLISILILFAGIGTLLFADGLPGEHYVTQRWRDAFSGHSPTLNPAFMTEENYLAFRMAVSPTLDNTFLLMELGTIIPIGLYHSLGLSYVGLNTNEDVNRSYFDYAQNKIIVTDEMVNDNQNLFIVSYAVNPWNRLSLGANLNMYQKANFDSSLIGMSFDFALSYRLFRHEVLGDHVLGVNVQNLLSPDFGFKQWMNEASNLKISWLGKIWESRINVGIDLDIKDFISQGEDFAEVAIAGGSPKKVEFDFNSRIGFWILNIININFQAGSNYWGICPGINVPTINNGRDLQMAYQYMSVVDDINLTSSHTFYVRADLGKHREEIYARRMAKIASLGPSVLYNKARTLYAEGKYWDAFFVFSRLLNEYPDFFKNDWVQLHMGLCQENMEMREFSVENYNEVKKVFPRSEVINYADLGILRINYRDNNSNGVLSQFTRINNSTAPDSVKYHAYYYMGMQYIRDGRYPNAIQLLSKVPEDHPEYVFAQFSLAVAYASSNNPGNVISTLNNVIQAQGKTREQTEMINRAMILLGYMLFEGIGVEKSLSQAVVALKKIPATSYYYEDAQIGIAWVALKAQQWADCMLACDQILNASNKTPLKCEAMLLKGYSLMVTKRYQEAADILTLADEQIHKLDITTEQERKAQTQLYVENRSTYSSIASAMNEYAASGMSVYMTKKVDSLHVPQVDLEGKLRGYQKYMDEYQRQAFFARPVDKLRSDIEYALAKAVKMAGEAGSIKIKESATEKIDKIEDEIKKYEEELKKMKEKK